MNNSVETENIFPQIKAVLKKQVLKGKTSHADSYCYQVKCMDQNYQTITGRVNTSTYRYCAERVSPNKKDSMDKAAE